MHKINPEHIQSLMGLMNQGPYYQLVSMELCAVDWGYARVEVDLQNMHHNPFGIVHGGLYSSVLDTAAYWCAYCELDEGVGLTTIDLSVNYLSMAREGKVIVEGRSIKVGRSICLTEAYAKGEDGKLLAQATAKLMVLDGRQTVAAVAEAMGYGTLPPKFLD